MVTKELIAATVDKQVVQQYRALAKESDRPFSRYVNDALVFWLSQLQDRVPV